MRSNESIFRICFRGISGCYWKHSTDNQRRNTCCWFSFLLFVSILVLGWMYICFVAFNDHNDVNWKAFEKLNTWVNWYMSIIILSAVLAIYCLLLLVFSLFQFAITEPLDLHWLHKVLLFMGLFIVLLGVATICHQWKEEWDTVYLSLEATAPFLQLGAVVALTMMSWLVFQSYHRTQRAVSKVLIIGALVVVASGIFISPIWIHSPCLTDHLPPKPDLVGHRGAPLLAPENTMMSFEQSVKCNVTAFETDVQHSKDMTPFLMHDKSLKRTTNIDKVFPNLTDNNSTDFTWEQLQMLNAGEWFIKKDPFWSISLLSEKEREYARNQTVPSLSELLMFAKKHNVSVIFDMKDEKSDCSHVVWTILNSGITQELIWWLPPKSREDVMKLAPGFRQVYKSLSTMQENNGSFLNIKYSSLSTKEISEQRRNNVTVNLWGVNERWLFSLMWCAGASSVTTNTCHVLKDMSRPDWHLAPYEYFIIWVIADLVSLLLMIILFLLQRRRMSRNQINLQELERAIPLLMKHNSSFQ